MNFYYACHGFALSSHWLVALFVGIPSLPFSISEPWFQSCRIQARAHKREAIKNDQCAHGGEWPEGKS